MSPLGVIGARTRAGNFLAVQNVTGCCPDAVHGSLAIEGDAMVVVGLAALVKSSIAKSFNALLIVIDLSLYVGEAMWFLLSGE